MGCRRPAHPTGARRLSLGVIEDLGRAYSVFNTEAGSTRAARHAGIQQANRVEIFMKSRISFEVRRARPEDVGSIAAAHLDSIQSIGPRYYEQSVVDDWAAGVSDELYLTAMARGEVFFVAIGELEGTPSVLGFSSHRCGAGEHRTAVYVRGRVSRLGVASALFRRAEEAAVEAGASRIDVDAALSALEFYRSRGFEEVGRGTHRLASGRGIACAFMRKVLGLRPSVSIEPFTLDMLIEAASTLARAFVTNPLHCAAFGPSRLDRNEAFFRLVLTNLQGPMVVAIEDSRILGLIHWVRAPRCRVPAIQKVQLLPAMVSHLGLGPALKLSSWLSAWSRLDPPHSHVHLGPIGVAPEAQGQHIGHLLMSKYCEDVDGARDAGYLETDRPENVAFYRRFRFATVTETPVLGVTNYMMWRSPRIEG